MNIEKLFEQHIDTIRIVEEQCKDKILNFAESCVNALKNGNTIFFMGNGGSAADSQHLAAEFVGRFVTERKGLPSIALTTDTSILTAVANDYGYENVFKRQVEALVRSGDVVVGISTSGNSNNVIRAINAAKEQGAVTIGLSGKDGGELARVCDICINVPCDTTARVQECHIFIGHMVCEYVDEVLTDAR